MNSTAYAVIALVIITAIVIVLFAVYSKVFHKVCFNVRDDWRTFYKWWSTWLTVIGSSLGGFLLAVPDAANGIWLAMPDEVKQRLPENFLLWVPLAIFIAAQIVKAFKQSRP